MGLRLAVGVGVAVVVGVGVAVAVGVGVAVAVGVAVVVAVGVVVAVVVGVAMSRPIRPYMLFHGSMIPNWLLVRPELEMSDKLIWSRLGQFEGKNGKAWPSVETLAKASALSESTVHRALRRLEEHGLLRIVRRHDETGRQLSSVYEFLWHSWMESPDHPLDGEGGVELTDRSVTVTGGEGVTDTPREGVTDTPKEIHSLRESLNPPERARARETESGGVRKEDVGEELRAEVKKKREPRRPQDAPARRVATIPLPDPSKAVLTPATAEQSAHAREVWDAQESTTEQSYQKAYELGVSACREVPYAMAESQRGALHQAILAHAGKRRGEALLVWVRVRAGEFAKFLEARAAREARERGAPAAEKMVSVYSSFGPRGFLRWLNEQPGHLADPFDRGSEVKLAAGRNKQRELASELRRQEEEAVPPPEDFLTALAEIGIGPPPKRGE